MALLIQKPVLRKRPKKIPPIGQRKPLPYEPPAAHIEPWLMPKPIPEPGPEPQPRPLPTSKPIPTPTPKPQPKPIPFPILEPKPIGPGTTTQDMEKIRNTIPIPKPGPKTPEIKDKVNLIDLVGNVQDVKSEPSTKPTIPISKITTTAKPTIPTQKATTTSEPGFDQLEHAITGNQTTENEAGVRVIDFMKIWGALILILVLIGLFLGGRRK